MKGLLLTLYLFGAPNQLPPLGACQALCEDLASNTTLRTSIEKGNLAVLRWFKRRDCQEDCMSHPAKEVAEIRLWLLQQRDDDYSDVATCMSKSEDWKGCFKDGC
jgi:hypothetical protein